MHGEQGRREPIQPINLVTPMLHVRAAVKCGKLLKRLYEAVWALVIVTEPSQQLTICTGLLWLFAHRRFFPGD
jgi:hypothetical protein